MCLDLVKDLAFEFDNCVEFAEIVASDSDFEVEDSIESVESDSDFGIEDSVEIVEFD